MLILNVPDPLGVAVLAETHVAKLAKSCRDMVSIDGRCNAVGASACGPIQPLSGPYLDYSSDPRRTGLLFQYFDRSGRALTPDDSPLDLARIDITARAESRQRIDAEGRVIIPSDSATTSVAIRNRSP